MWNLSPLNCSSNTSCLLHLQALQRHAIQNVEKNQEPEPKRVTSKRFFKTTQYCDSAHGDWVSMLL